MAFLLYAGVSGQKLNLSRERERGRQIRLCVGRRLRPEGLLTSFLLCAGVSRLNDDRLAAMKIPCVKEVFCVGGLF